MFDLIVKTAFLSLFRRKLRTFLVVFMVASSLWGLMFMQGIYDGMIEQMISNAIKSDSGEISIYAKDFRRDKDVKQYIKNYKDIEDYIKQNENIKSYTTRVLASGIIATAKYSKNANIYAVDLECEKEHAKLNGYIKEGIYGFGEKSKGIMIGFKLAKKLKLSLGKKVVLSSQNSDNEITSASLKVTAIIKTNNMGLDENGVFIDIKKAKEFLNIKGVSQVSIVFKDPGYMYAFQKEIIRDFKSKRLEVFRWDQLYPALMQSRKYMEMFGYISYMIVFLMATVGIFGVVLVSVLERLREFAILRAVGTRFGIISSIIFLESFLLAMAGFILGIIFGGGTLYYFSIYGLDLSAFSDALDEFGMDAVTYAIIKANYFITAFLAVMSATILSIIVPLKILYKSKPTEVING